ncbi:carboxylesterase/lipase family protein [Pseudonocardia acaciae]|uniref:carboxylesterase/lipase family protein n=1 Tax=Pseudonocardia acaciae TaxID=551276 RepID=UPI000A57E717|nr:carboxylesterase/lipase family protein [Pseudonocardia acaciae]
MVVVAAVVGLGATTLAGCSSGTDGNGEPRRGPAVVGTDDGPVRGTVADGYRTFQGIPYAAPPVGKLRWAPPAPVTPWEQARDATRPGNTCPQSASLLDDPASDTEDCLYLNVTTPDHAENEKLPVMFWIHGGGFYFGSGHAYQALRMATRGRVVVVTLNYRLGALGYLAHPEFGKLGEDLEGNYGMQDQQAALRWVRRNIERFGGDEDNVTVFGESAGGVSTCAQVASPAAEGLFARAIVQSGPCAETKEWPHDDGYWFARPRGRAEAQGLALAKTLGCADAKTAVECLRTVPTEKVLAASDGGGYGPMYGGGGDVLPIGPAEAIRTGAFNRVPVMHGITRDEHSTFIWAIETFTRHSYNADDYRQLITEFFGPNANRVLAQYPLTDYSSPSLALSTLFSDYSWGCPAVTTADELSKHVPTYAYEFADRNPPWGKDMPKANFPTGAMHIGEIQYLFNNPEFPGPLSADQQKLSDAMIDYWTRFARAGDPNGGPTPNWPAYRSVGDVLSLAPSPEGIRPVDLGAEHRCGFWRSINR